MKTCDEMVNSLLERREQFLSEQKQKRRTAAKITAAGGSCALAAVIGVLVFNSGMLREKKTMISDNSSLVNDGPVKDDPAKGDSTPPASDAHSAVSDNSSAENDKPAKENSTPSAPDNSTAISDNSSVNSEPAEDDPAPGHTDNIGDMLPFSELARPYGDKTVTAETAARLWEWEYLTVPEQYTSMELYGKEFYTRREIGEALLGDTLGSYEISGSDWYTGQTYSRTFEVRQIKGVSDKLMAAVKMDGKYYIFKNGEYAPPSTFGELLDSYSLADTVELHRFTPYKGYSDTGWYRLENDDTIWQILAGCRNAAFIKEDFRDRSGENGISFTVTSEALGVYKNVLSISDDGYLRTNIFDWGYNFYIGEEAANRIISYAAANAAPAAYEPYTYSIAGTLTEIHDGYFLVDDSVLCEDPGDGMVFKVLTDDLRISRYIDGGEIGLGDLISVSFAGDIDIGDSNRITDIRSISRARLYDGAVMIEE